MSNELSEYEKKRLENIKQNQEILKSLNIKGIIPDELKNQLNRLLNQLVPVLKRRVFLLKKQVVQARGEGGRRVSSRLLRKSDYLKV